jgi:hypothetical protein
MGEGMVAEEPKAAPDIRIESFARALQKRELVMGSDQAEELLSLVAEVRALRLDASRLAFHHQRQQQAVQGACITCARHDDWIRTGKDPETKT